jgi:class 3 adenylate cyclase
MNYDAFSLQYERTQVERIGKAMQAIRSRGLSLGREIPSDDALVIGTGRRLPMAVMFLDICGFSSRAMEDQQEQLSHLRALNLFFTELVRIAEDYGGTVEKNTGDGLMTYFEDGTQALESGCKRAVSCALTMQRSANHLLNPVLDRSGIERMDFRIGIDHGQVTIARLGAARRFNALVAVGTAANVACKMLRFGGPNEIIIGDSVRKEIPASWHQYTSRIQEDSGWVYRASGQQYPFFRYTGRWNA